jgi:hypothetical protein
VRGGGENGAAVVYTSCDACVFAHNTLVEPKRSVARILEQSGDAGLAVSRDGLFVDNLVLVDTWQLTMPVEVSAGAAPATFSFGNNLWFAIDQPSYAGPMIGMGIPPEMGSLVQQDPRLVDRAGGNYRPMASSPLVAAARLLSFVAPDYDGRCHAMPATIGAFAVP